MHCAAGVRTVNVVLSPKMIKTNHTQKTPIIFAEPFLGDYYSLSFPLFLSVVKHHLVRNQEVRILSIIGYEGCRDRWLAGSVSKVTE